MMSNLFKGYLVDGDKTFIRYIQHQKYKYNNGDIIYKDKLMPLVLKRYYHLCTKDKWIAKSLGEQQIVALSEEL